MKKNCPSSNKLIEVYRFAKYRIRIKFEYYAPLLMEHMLKYSSIIKSIIIHFIFISYKTLSPNKSFANFIQNNNLFSLRQIVILKWLKRYVKTYQDKNKYQKKYAIFFQDNNVRKTLKVSGWTNNQELLTREFNSYENVFSKSLFFYSRKDLKNIEGARAFELQLNFENKILLSRIESLFSQVFKFNPSVNLSHLFPNLTGYVDYIGLEIDLIKFKLNKLKNYFTLLNIKKSFLLHRNINLLELSDNERSNLAHLFHVNFFDWFIDLFGIKTSLLMIKSLNLFDYLISNYYPLNPSKLICEVCKKEFSIENISICESVFPNFDLRDSEYSKKLNEHWYELRDATITKNRIVLNNLGNHFITRTGFNSESKFISDWSESIIFNAASDSIKSIISKPSTEPIHLDSAIFLSGNNMKNFYHCIIDCFSTLAFYPLSNHDPVILLPINTHPNLISILSRLVKNPIFLMDESKTYLVSNLFCSVNFNFIVDVPLDTNCKVEYYLDPKSILFLRNRIQKMELEKTFKEDGKFKNIAFLRSNTLDKTKLLKNPIALRNLLKKYSFTILDQHELSFEEQVFYSKGADYVFIQGGSSITLLLYLKKGTTVFVLNSTRSRHFYVFNALAKILDINIVTIYESRIFSNNFISVLSSINKPYYADVSGVRNQLNKFL